MSIKLNTHETRNSTLAPAAESGAAYPKGWMLLGSCATLLLYLSCAGEEPRTTVCANGAVCAPGWACVKNGDGCTQETLGVGGAGGATFTSNAQRATCGNGTREGAA